jgi:hypothetical protein
VRRFLAEQALIRCRFYQPGLTRLVWKTAARPKDLAVEGTKPLFETLSRAKLLSATAEHTNNQRAFRASTDRQERCHEPLYRLQKGRDRKRDTLSL